MTIPYLPGWFDQNKEAIQNIVGTVARVVDPTIENRMMLQQMMQNPQNVQQLVDIASLNPQLIQNLYGAQNLSRIQGMGTPSATAQVEAASRDILRTGQVPETPVGEAAAAAMRFRTPAQKRREELEIKSAEQQLDYYGFRLGQDRLEAAAKNPALQAQMRTIDAALAANPEAASYDPRGLAQEYFSGTGDRTALMSKINAMAAANPVAAELFSDSLRTISQNDLQNRVDARALQREREAAARSDNVLDRQLRMEAIDLATKFGADINDALKFVRGEAGGEVVGTLIRNSLEDQQRVTRLRQLSALTGQLTQYAKAKGSEKPTILAGINTSLQEFVPGISLVSGTDFFDKKTKYMFNGQEINGEQFSQILSNPQAAMAQMQESAAVNAMTLEQAQAELQGLEQIRNRVTPDVYTRTKALLEARIRTAGRVRR